jgi:hypothetical protein
LELEKGENFSHTGFTPGIQNSLSDPTQYNDFLRCRSSENCKSFLTVEGKDEFFVKCSAEYIQFSSKTEEQPFCTARNERQGLI